LSFSGLDLSIFSAKDGATLPKTTEPNHHDRQTGDTWAFYGPPEPQTGRYLLELARNDGSSDSPRNHAHTKAPAQAITHQRTNNCRPVEGEINIKAL